VLELRYLIRKRKDLPPEFNSLSPNAKETVLQYRQKLISGAWGCIPPTNAPTEWSKWIDVPTVKE